MKSIAFLLVVLLALTFTAGAALGLTLIGQFLPLEPASTNDIARGAAAVLCLAVPLWVDLRLTRFIRRENPTAKHLLLSAQLGVNLLWLIGLGLVIGKLECLAPQRWHVTLADR